MAEREKNRLLQQIEEIKGQQTQDRAFLKEKDRRMGHTVVAYDRLTAEAHAKEDSVQGRETQKMMRAEINSAVEMDKGMDKGMELGSLDNLRPRRRAITDRVGKETKQVPYNIEDDSELNDCISTLKKKNSQLRGSLMP